MAETEMSYRCDHIVPQLQELLLSWGVTIPSWNAGEWERQQFSYAVLKAVLELGLGDGDPQEVARQATAWMLGLGVLEPYLGSDGVEEVVVRNGFVQVYRHGTFHGMGPLAPDSYFRALAHKVADFGGKELSAANPMVVVDIPGGARFACVIPPLSTEGTAINIRRFGVRRLTLQDLAAGPVITPETGERAAPLFDEATAVFLAQVAEEMRMSVLISGRPGSGKTTLLNAFSAHLSETAQVCVAETYKELELAIPHLVRCVVTEDMEERGKVTMARVVNALYTRMRPDVLIVGEVVGLEAREYLQAINLGVVAHATIHGNSALDALHRLETLAMQRDLPLLAVQERIARGVGLVLHLDMDAQGCRTLTELVRIKGFTISGDVGHYELERVDKETSTQVHKE